MQPRRVIVDADVLRCAHRSRHPKPHVQRMAVELLMEIKRNLRNRICFTPHVKVEFLAHVSEEYRKKAEGFLDKCIQLRVYDEDYDALIQQIDELRAHEFKNPKTGQKENCAAGGVVDNLNTLLAVRLGFELLGIDKAYVEHKRHFGDELRLIDLKKP